MIPAKYYKDIKLQSGAKKLQSGAKKSQSRAGITKWGKNYKVAHNRSHFKQIDISFFAECSL